MKYLFRKNKSAFTLLEVLVATALIGIAIAALVGSGVSHTKANSFGIETSTAEFLVDEIKSLTASLAVVDPDSEDDIFGPESDESSVIDYDDLDDFDGKIISPPVDVSGAALTDFSGYSQTVTVENVSPADLKTAVADHGSSLVKITVSIDLNNNQLTSASWIRARL